MAFMDTYIQALSLPVTFTKVRERERELNSQKTNGLHLNVKSSIYVPCMQLIATCVQAPQSTFKSKCVVQNCVYINK